jgi:hypothetical protein
MAGLLRVDLVKGKSLIKSDLIGKSDPYAVIELGKQTGKTHAINNTQVLSIFKGETKMNKIFLLYFLKDCLKTRTAFFHEKRSKSNSLFSSQYFSYNLK